MFITELKELQGINKAYLQVIDGELVNDAAFYFYNGCKLLNIETEKFEDKDFENIELSKDTIVSAGVPVMMKVFQKLGVEIPKPLDIPEGLEKYCGRKISIDTLEDLLKKTGYPIFVKPAEKGKLFGGQIVSCKEELELFQYADEIDGINTKIFSSEVVKIMSEFRCFVLQGEVYDCRKYKGGFDAVPDFKVIEECVKAYKSSPIAYGIDFGVTDNGETILIEANDGYSLGPYGFDSYNYTRMMILRWKEIVGI